MSEGKEILLYMHSKQTTTNNNTVYLVFTTNNNNTMYLQQTTIQCIYNEHYNNMNDTTT